MAGRYFRRPRHAAPDLLRRSSKGRLRALRCEQLEDRRLLAVLTVDTELDVVDFNDGQMSLREAVFVANTVEGIDEIRFDFGHDQPATMLLTGGEMAITEGLAIVGPGSDVFTIDAQQNSRIFNVSGEGVHAELSGMTLLNGRTTGDNLTTSEITQQKYSGGAIRSASPAALSVDDVVIRGSSVTGANASGGAIFAAATLNVANSVISGNSASGRNGVGGGVAMTASASIRATTISSNVASRGGGVSVSSTGNLDIDRSTLNSNVAADSYAALGGAIYSTGWLNIRSSTISSNAARATGFDAVAQGAGVWTSGGWEIAFSTIVGNTASSVGTGAVATAGGVYSRFTPTPEDQDWVLLDHTIVAGNFATEGNADFLRASTVRLDIYHSLVGDNDGSLLREAPVGGADGYGNLVGGTTYGIIDPLLGGLKDNGGPTRTHALLPGSPAIFAGDPDRAPGRATSSWPDLPDTPEFDQRGEGYSRHVGTRLDIGAVEYSGRTLIVDSLADDVDGDYGAGRFTLREALGMANENADYDVIEFSPSILKSWPATIFLKNGELAITQEAAIYGPGAERLVISGSQNRNYSRVINASANVEVRGLTITAGNLGNYGEGGGIYSTKNLTLIDVAVTDSTAGRGAGIHGVGLTLFASRVEGNQAFQGTGGIDLTGSLHMDRSIVRGNGSSVAVTSSSVGGIRVGSSSTANLLTEVIVANSVITNNTGIDTGGIRSSSSLFVMYNTLVGENSGRSAGGLYIDGREILLMSSSVVRNIGVGFRLSAVVPGSALIEDSTISGNRTGIGGNGSGIVTNAPLTVRRTTITNNVLREPGTASGGSGISTSGRLLLESSIVAGNYGPTAPDVLVTGRGTISAANSLIGDNRGSTLAEMGPDQSSTNRIGGPVRGVLSPGLGPLMNNGGWLPTHLPLPGSVAINMGAPSDETTPEFDQRGMPYERVVDRRMDSGAVEAQRTWNGGSPTGDFNQDGKVDGADFLAWQRGYGKADAAVSDGDGTADGMVDGNDLAFWKMRVSSSAPPVQSAVAIAASAVEVVGVADSNVVAAVADEIVPTTAGKGLQQGSIPLTPAAKEFAVRTGAERLLAVKHAAFAEEREARGKALEFLDGWEQRSVTGDLSFEVENVDEAFAEQGMERLAWGLTGR